jgi:hypothetical protein
LGQLGSNPKIGWIFDQNPSSSLGSLHSLSSHNWAAQPELSSFSVKRKLKIAGVEEEQAQSISNQNL